MRVHLICDHKWRDLPSNVVLKLYLEQIGHRVTIGSLKESLSLVPAVRPDAVAFNHVFSEAHQDAARAIRAAGSKVIVLPTEGTCRPGLEPVLLGDYSDFSVIDLYLSWNEKVSHGLRTRGRIPDSGIATTGCYRFDFHVPPLRSATMPREDFCKIHRLDPLRSVVTWATQYNYAHLVEAGPKREKFLNECAEIGVRDCYSRIGIDVADIPAILAASREAAFDAFLKATHAYPDVQFLIKPHPAEDQSYYQALVAAMPTENIRLVPAEMIWDVLNATDLLLHRQCTTAVEAWIRELPTIEMAMTRDRAFAWPQIEAGSDAAETADELTALIRKHLSLRDVSAARHAIRQSYIAEHFHAADGHRTAETALALDRYLREHVKSRASFFKLAKSMNGVRSAAKAGLRYWLDVPPGKPLNEHLRRRVSLKTPLRPSDGSSKQVTRGDVAREQRRLAPHLEPRTGNGKDRRKH